MRDLSLENQVALLPPHEQEAILADLDMTNLLWDWSWNGRPSQILPVLPEEGGDDWTLALALAGRGFGKMVSYDTMLPHTLPVGTSTGFTKMGDIGVGDTVYDEQGKPCTVLATFDRTPDVAYRVTFSDGTFIDACDEHQWVTWTHRDRKQYLRNNPGATDFPTDWVVHREPLYRASSKGGKVPTGESVGPEIRTTQQILDTLKQETARGDLNHCIPTTRPLQTPPVHLPVAPWLLGYWLGKGHYKTGHITGHLDDLPGIEQEVAEAWLSFGKFQDDDGRQKFEVTVKGLSGGLRQIGVLGNKHVPDTYLWASEPQRRALLAGLLDSDGYCDPVSGHIEFCSMTRTLADAVVQLARSLGEKPVLGIGRARLYRVDHGEKYRVTWRPTVNPFRLPRKAAVVKPLGSQGLRNRHRMITSIERIPSLPMRCITVDSPNSMYLVGEGMIPTHNTLMGSQWIRALDANWHRMGRDTEHLRFALLGRTAADVRDVMLEGQSGLMNIYPPSLRDQVVWTPSRRRIELPNGAVGIAFSAEEPDQLRGPAFAVGWADELASYKQLRSIEGNATAWQNLRIGVRLGKRPQILATTTPKRVPVLKELLAEAKDTPTKFLLRRGRTLDNLKLSSEYLDTLISLYAGTHLGRQELDGEMLDDVVGALTSEEVLNNYRVTGLPPGIPWIKIIGVDPSVAEKPHDECGIIVVYISKTWPILKRHAFVVEDLSQRVSPTVWGDIVVRAAHEHGATVVAETNQGAALVKQMMRQSAAAANLPMPPFRETWSAKSKAVRSEPIGGAYARGRMHHVNVLPELEDQLVSWVPGESGYSPDRLDGLVHGAASGLFPEALVHGLPTGNSIHSPVNGTIPLTRQIEMTRRRA